MAEHTPTPWQIDDAPDSNYGCQIAANTKVKAKRVVCRLGGPDREANAAFIVRAVNRDHHFDALVKALEQIAQGGNEVHRSLPNSKVLTREQMANIAYAALATVDPPPPATENAESRSLPHVGGARHD